MGQIRLGWRSQDLAQEKFSPGLPRPGRSYLKAQQFQILLFSRPFELYFSNKWMFRELKNRVELSALPKTSYKTPSSYLLF